ncbi:MAG: hypothetical protein ACJAXS_001871 [Colwellia sp.]|jgi:hypothetical protein
MRWKKRLIKINLEVFKPAQTMGVYCLQGLVNRGLITKQDAMEKAVDKNQFRGF